MTDWMIWPSLKVVKIVKSGGHDELIESDTEFKDLVKSMTMQAMIKSGLNQAIGYDGTSRDEDCILWLHSLLGRVPKII